MHYMPQSPQMSRLELITVKDVALILNVDSKTVYRWWHSGKLPQPVSLVGWTRWRRSDIEDWLAQQHSEVKG